MSVSFQNRIRQLVLFAVAPLVTCIVALLVFFIITNRQYNNTLANLSLAGSFNEDFQTTIDFKMYQVVINREMFAQLAPLGDIAYAQEIVSRLLETTTDADSAKHLADIGRYLGLLTNNISLIVEDQGYEQNMLILDRRIRVLTSLVREKMQEYIHNETQLMTATRDDANRNFAVLFVVFVCVLAALVIFIIAVSFRMSRRLARPLKELIENFASVGEGNFSIRPIDLASEEIIALHAAFEGMVAKIEKLMEHISQEKDNLRKIEFALLQSQINPHFLYNTFDTIIWLTEDGEYEKVKKMMMSLSTFCRIALSGGEDIITIREETSHAESYLEIQQIRYFDVLDYEIDVSYETLDCLIPKLSLQPLVENALYHGIKQKRGGGAICIECGIEDGRVAVCVSDTGNGMTKDELEAIEKSGYGLGNVHARLRLYFHEDVTFEIFSEHGEYTAVKFTIPMRKA